MSRKRDDSEWIDNGLHLLTKKIKSPLATVDQLNTNGNHHENSLYSTNPTNYENKFDHHGQNEHGKLSTISNLPIQPSANVCHNRKRRSRAAQEIYDSNTLSPTMLCSTTNSNNQARKKSDLSCVVCSGSAHGYNFDAISCESCKAFFRRNALFNTDRLKCRRDGTCEITLETRRRCKSCRLKKCFAVGMRKEWILTEEEKINKKRRIEENRKLRFNTETPCLDMKSDLELQNVVLNKITSEISIGDEDIISNIVTAFNEGFQLDRTSYGWSYPLAKKITALCQILNTKNTTALRLISFYKRLREFDALNEIDKVNLIKINLSHIFILYASFGYDPSEDIYREGISTNESSVYYGSDIREVHGDDIYTRCTSIMRALYSIVEKDRRIIQFSLVIFLFSKSLSSIINTNETLSNNSEQIYETQNLFVEQLWLLIEKSFGLKEARRIFSTLVFQFLRIQKLLRDIQQDLNEKVDVSQVPPIIRSLMNLS